MSDLISLNCPSCGGALKVTPSTTALTCEHCGREHLVRHEAGAVLLESFARCPKCGRNDRVEKASAILASHTHNVVAEREVVRNVGGQPGVVRVPVGQTQVSSLAQRLSPPVRPAPPKPVGGNGFWVILTVVGGLVALLFRFFLLAWFSSRSGNAGADAELGMCTTWSGVCSLVTILVGLLGIIKGSSAAARRAREEQAKYEQSVRKWEQAVRRWDALYYCYRDDCVFIPGEGTSAPLRELMQYLFSG
jgi:predicted RNA-binding Zn-ribbon protein involved in translation (DUF1610 family)